MKNQTTSKRLATVRNVLSGFILLMVLSVQSFAQSQTCHAHFYHNGFNATVYYSGSFNPPGTTYAWDFGDGSTGAIRSMSHTYTASGTYYVCLTVSRTDTAGTVLCTATWCDSVHVTLPPPPPPPVCNAHFYHNGFNANVYFAGAMNPPGTTYAWDFGDGSTGTMLHTNHTYTASGTYYVCLTVTDADTAGTVLCTATWCDSVYVTLPPPPPPPVCNAHFYHNGFNANVHFVGAMNPPGTTYVWDFGDGSTGTGAYNHHTYTASGTYYVCLTVTDTDTAGTVLCTATWCDSVHVTVPPPPPGPTCDAHFYHHRIFGSGILFVSAHNPSGTTYAWDFGDGTTGTSSYLTHTYTAGGTYYVCLTVTDADTSGNVLCTATWCDSVHVNPPPPLCNAHFGHFAVGNQGLDVYFDAAFNPHTVTYAWDFGDGSTATGDDTVHTYALPGTYYACLTVTNTDTSGNVICTDTWCDSVHVDTNFVNNHHHHHGCDRLKAGQDVNTPQSVATIYPNPVAEKATLHIENTTGNVSFRIFESTGRLVMMKENLTNGDFELNKNELGQGLYFYQINDSNGNVLNGKLIVQ